MKRYKVIERFVSFEPLFIGTYEECEYFEIRNRFKYKELTIQIYR